MSERKMPPSGARVRSRGYEGIVERTSSERAFLLVQDSGEDHVIYVSDLSWEIVDEPDPAPSDPRPDPRTHPEFWTE